MAESDASTTTPADDGRARVNDNGTVTTDGRPAWVWVEDEVTGHRFDMPDRALPRAGLKVVEGYPLNYDAAARLGKSRRELAADPAVDDVHEDVVETGAPAPVSTGDEAHAEKAAAAPVETGAPEISTSGDAQQQETAAAERPEGAGDDVEATTKTTTKRQTRRSAE